MSLIGESFNEKTLWETRSTVLVSEQSQVNTKYLKYLACIAMD